MSGLRLRGQSAGSTALCTVGLTGTGLTYRGYDISELAEKASFEEVAHMLLKGHLPNQIELDAYTKKLKTMRRLPEALKTVLEHIPAQAHPMDVMRTGCSMLGNLEPEADFTMEQEVTERLLALFQAIICYWYRFSHQNYINLPASISNLSMLSNEGSAFLILSMQSCRHISSYKIAIATPV